MSITVHRSGGRRLVLRRDAFVAAGGEGSVYARDGLAFKVFPSPAAAPSPDKLTALATLGSDAVLAPTEVLRTASGEPIGYAMPLAVDTVSLAQLTTRAFRRRVGFDDDDAFALVTALRDAIARIHAAGFVIVDLSPNNVLVRRGSWTPCLIDTDSWQTPDHDATAVTPSIRDPLAPAGPRFAPGSDWFAFAIVTFELLVGIHPFKGRHPRVHRLSERMRKGISVFDPHVRMPRVCASLDVIPSPLRAWYRDVLEHGDRSPPPGVTAPSTRLRAVARARSDAVTITPVAELTARIDLVASVHGMLVVAAAGALHVDGNARPCPTAPLAVVHTGGRVLAVGRDAVGRVTLDGDATPIVADELCGTRGRVFLRRGGDVLELLVHALGDRPVASTRLVANAMPKASTLYPGVLLQSVLGSMHATLLGTNASSRSGVACTQWRLPELDRVAVVDARHDGGVLVVVTCHDGGYDRFVFRFDGARGNYDCRVTRGVAPLGAVLATTPAGICVARVDEGLEVFSARPGVLNVHTVPFETSADATLLAHDGAVLHVHGCAVDRLAYTVSR